jgi:hypothetical protein
MVTNLNIWKAFSGVREIYRKTEFKEDVGNDTFLKTAVSPHQLTIGHMFI